MLNTSSQVREYGLPFAEDMHPHGSESPDVSDKSMNLSQRFSVRSIIRRGGVAVEDYPKVYKALQNRDIYSCLQGLDIVLQPFPQPDVRLLWSRQELIEYLNKETAEFGSSIIRGIDVTNQHNSRLRQVTRLIYLCYWQIMHNPFGLGIKWNYEAYQFWQGLDLNYYPELAELDIVFLKLILGWADIIGQCFPGVDVMKLPFDIGKFILTSGGGVAWCCSGLMAGDVPQRWRWYFYFMRGRRLRYYYFKNPWGWFALGQGMNNLKISIAKNKDACVNHLFTLEQVLLVYSKILTEQKRLAAINQRLYWGIHSRSQRVFKTVTKELMRIYGLWQVEAKAWCVYLLKTDNLLDKFIRYPRLGILLQLLANVLPESTKINKQFGGDSTAGLAELIASLRKKLIQQMIAKVMCYQDVGGGRVGLAKAIFGSLPGETYLAWGNFIGHNYIASIEVLFKLMHLPVTEDSNFISAMQVTTSLKILASYLCPDHITTEQRLVWEEAWKFRVLQGVVANTTKCFGRHWDLLGTLVYKTNNIDLIKGYQRKSYVANTLSKQGIDIITCALRRDLVNDVSLQQISMVCQVVGGSPLLQQQAEHLIARFLQDDSWFVDDQVTAIVMRLGSKQQQVRYICLLARDYGEMSLFIQDSVRQWLARHKDSAKVIAVACQLYRSAMLKSARLKSIGDYFRLKVVWPRFVNGCGSDDSVTLEDNHNKLTSYPLLPLARNYIPLVLPSKSLLRRHDPVCYQILLDGGGHDPRYDNWIWRSWYINILTLGSQARQSEWQHFIDINRCKFTNIISLFGSNGFSGWWITTFKIIINNFTCDNLLLVDLVKELLIQEPWAQGFKQGGDYQQALAKLNYLRDIILFKGEIGRIVSAIESGDFASAEPQLLEVTQVIKRYDKGCEDFDFSLYFQDRLSVHLIKVWEILFCAGYLTGKKGIVAQSSSYLCLVRTLCSAQVLNNVMQRVLTKQLIISRHADKLAYFPRLLCFSLLGDCLHNNGEMASLNSWSLYTLLEYKFLLNRTWQLRLLAAVCICMQVQKVNKNEVGLLRVVGQLIARMELSSEDYQIFNKAVRSKGDWKFSEGNLFMVRKSLADSPNFDDSKLAEIIQGRFKRCVVFIENFDGSGRDLFKKHHEDMMLPGCGDLGREICGYKMPVLAPHC